MITQKNTINNNLLISGAILGLGTLAYIFVKKNKTSQGKLREER